VICLFAKFPEVLRKVIRKEYLYHYKKLASGGSNIVRKSYGSCYCNKLRWVDHLQYSWLITKPEKIIKMQN
jgi:hypothetical protein